ncbi:hypothetical protein BV898_15956 [Hypsibius exemplaris]|uniref:Uncharacterized protein n=1 Tax=Hypsibius exemplaris TaxID=2072580 RepID=A0A9X6NCM0_HYPEX|nr:hypothetical protein BV898_15956 [Hypsibius exemplaris]
MRPFRKRMHSLAVLLPFLLLSVGVSLAQESGGPEPAASSSVSARTREFSPTVAESPRRRNSATTSLTSKQGTGVPLSITVTTGTAGSTLLNGAATGTGALGTVIQGTPISGGLGYGTGGGYGQQQYGGGGTGGGGYGGGRLRR